MAVLPDELWQIVFYRATDNPARREWEQDGPLELQPFETFREDADRESANEAFGMKACISVVCSRWRRLSSKFLFEDIRIRHGSFALARKLEERIDPTSNITFGEYVRRIIIPVDMSGVWHKTLEVNARRILAACQNTLILARRYESFRTRFPRSRNSRKTAIDDVQMPKLRRIDWNNSPAHHQRRDKHGLPTFVWEAPSLEILSVSDYMVKSRRRSLFGMEFPWCPSGKVNALNPTSLTSIHTLRLDCWVDHDTLVEILGKENRLPSLRRIVINVSQGAAFSLFSRCIAIQGAQLQVVEIANREPIWIRSLWKDVLVSCPNIQSFDLDIAHFTVEKDSVPNGSLKEIKLFMRKEDFPNRNVHAPLSVNREAAIYDKLMSIIKDTALFPQLNRIELHGTGWTSVYKESLKDLEEAAEKRNLLFSLEPIDV